MPDFSPSVWRNHSNFYILIVINILKLKLKTLDRFSRQTVNVLVLLSTLTVNVQLSFSLEYDLLFCSNKLVLDSLVHCDLQNKKYKNKRNTFLSFAKTFKIFS